MYGKRVCMVDAGMYEVVLSSVILCIMNVKDVHCLFCGGSSYHDIE
jgi:hypothetical protein